MQENIVLPSNFLTYGKLGVAINGLADSNKYINIFIRMLFIAAQNDGVIQKATNEGYTKDELINLCCCEEQDFSLAIERFVNTNLIRIDNGIIVIVNWLDYCDSTTKKRLKAKESYWVDKNKIIADYNDTFTQEIDSFFESVWKLYPNKKGKGQVSFAKKKSLYNIGYEQIAKSIDRYKEYLKMNNITSKYIMHGSTFFNGGYVDYLDTNFEGNQVLDDGRKKSAIEQLMAQIGGAND